MSHFSVGEGIKLEVLKIESWNLFLGGLYLVNENLYYNQI